MTAIFKLHAGGKFGQGGYKLRASLGTSVVFALNVSKYQCFSCMGVVLNGYARKIGTRMVEQTKQVLSLLDSE